MSHERHCRTACALLVVATAVTACDSGERRARDAVMMDAVVAAPPAPLAVDSGEATFYSDLLHRRRTASGELMDQEALVAAHRRYPFGTRLRVTNVRNGRSVEVRVIDRGPYGPPKVAARKIIDLSRRAAREIGILAEGRARVRVEVLSYGEPR